MKCSSCECRLRRLWTKHGVCGRSLMTTDNEDVDCHEGFLPAADTLYTFLLFWLVIGCELLFNASCIIETCRIIVEIDCRSPVRCSFDCLGLRSSHAKTRRHRRNRKHQQITLFVTSRLKSYQVFTLHSLALQQLLAASKAVNRLNRFPPAW